MYFGNHHPLLKINAHGKPVVKIGDAKGNLDNEKAQNE